MNAVSIVLRQHDTPSTEAILRISQLPKSSHKPTSAGLGQTPMLLEGAEYRYDLELPHDLRINYLEPSGFFDPDTDSWKSGRLRTGEAVGIWSIEIRCSGGQFFEGQLDVRCTKLDEDAFAAMLGQLAELSTEVLHQGFAASSGRYSPNYHKASRLMYQQFAVLSALLKGDDLKLAIDHFQSHPYSTWRTEVAPQSASRPLPGSSRLSRQLAKPGPRLPVSGLAIGSLPRTLNSEHTVETLDNLPNRYVKFVLEQWRELANSVLSMTKRRGHSVQRRGQVEAQAALDYLDEVLNSPMVRAIGQLRGNLGDNPVLRHREGYRQIVGFATIIDSSLDLDVDIDDPFLISRRSVSTLYEIWVFVRLAQALAAVFDQRFLPELFRPADHGMTLLLRPGQERVLSFRKVVDQQELVANLFFNRSFSKHDGGPNSGTSWSRGMRPDASVVIRRVNGSQVWLHFDAKYKLRWADIDKSDDFADSNEGEPQARAQDTDLIKMHAYRDAIWDSAGSYVLFPGDAPTEFTKQYREPLPGIGAIPLRPEAAEPDMDYLKDFIERVVSHVAAGGTRDRRASYWTNRAYRERGVSSPVAIPPRGDLPPADTSVLVGYVRSDEQWEWIEESNLYNVRSGDRRGALVRESPALDADLLLLWSKDNGVQSLKLFHRVGVWNAVTATEMTKLGYRNPRGNAYLVARVERADEEPEWLNAVRVEKLKPKGSVTGAPFGTSWLDLAISVG